MATKGNGDADRSSLDHPSETMTPSLSSIIADLKSSKEQGSESTSPMVSTEQQASEGSECAIQTLYEGPPKCGCCKNWVEEYPDDLRMSVEEQPETKQKALIVRMRKNHGEGKPLVLDSIVVQCSSLKETLGEVFKGYKGITASLKKVVFKSPFHPFYYRWRLFAQIIERQKHDDPSAVAYSQLLYNVLNTELHDVMTEIEDLLHHRVMTYSLLWALFEPGMHIISASGSHERFFIVDSCGYNNEKGYLGINVKFVDWDGERFGYASGMLAICEYAGTRAITELNVFPASFHPLKEEMEAKAIARGRRFWGLRGFHYMAYSGLIQYTVGKNEVERNIDGRIVVDAASYFHNNPNEKHDLADLASESITPQIRITDDSHISSPSRRCGTGLARKMALENEIRQRKVENGELPTERKMELIHDLTDEQLLLCNTHLRGYSLKLKRWATFDVNKISRITWNDAAFPKLMLPSGYKNLILSFVEGQSTNKCAFDDIIEGKGLGVIMLLVGNPGTGKTLTAEAVADKVRRPLYVLSAGELGQEAKAVENRLNTILELTERWDAVLLFDECDVFLQERSTSHLAHNEIVAVFLRLLEYYRGILLMTSNRADTIDRAFQSRIHLTLHYPDLEPAAKEDIWRQFIAQSKEENVLTDEAYKRLATLPMNGRQIKNVVKIATLLAKQENANLGIEQIRTVLQATREVDAEGI